MSDCLSPEIGRTKKLRILNPLPTAQIYLVRLLTGMNDTRMLIPGKTVQEYWLVAQRLGGQPNQITCWSS
jgi:hypothetical protein